MSSSRLPGIYFETVVPSVPEPLPRLDIAAFVGFAASGPLDIPVAVEDAARFQEIFGKDQPLAWDQEAGEVVYAQLPPAVRAFFRNGGQRSWVVRVADNTAAASNSFVIPGMLQASPGLDYEPAVAVARSEGSWSDKLMVNATLSYLPFAADRPQRTYDGISILLHTGSSSAISPGDLLQIGFDSVARTPPTTTMPLLFLPVDTVENSIVTENGASKQVTTVTGSTGYWFQPATGGDFANLLGSPPFAGADPSTTWLVPPLGLTRLTSPEDTELAVGGWGLAGSAGFFELVVVALRSQAENIPAGTWLRMKLNAADLPPGARELVLLVDNVRGSVAQADAIFASPAAMDEETVEIVVKAAWWVLDPNASWGLDLSSPHVDIVTLQLWVRDGSGQITTLENLGLSSEHAFYFGYLPTDVELYAQRDNPEPPPGSALWADVDHPRFPLAVNLSETSGGPGTFPDFLPLGIPGLVNPDYYQPAISAGGTPLQRDGLDFQAEGALGTLPASLFLDPDLADCGVQTLLTAAFHKQYQLRREGNSGPPGERLEKMHAVLPLEEISLLALPDAPHLGWTQSASEAPQLLGAPILKEILPPDEEGQIASLWTSVTDAVSYTLEQSRDPQFGSSSISWQGGGQEASPPDVGLVESGRFLQPAGCPSTMYFRVAASDGINVGPWSNTLAQALPLEAFERCTPSTIDAPTLGAPAKSRGRIVLAWSESAANLDGFQVQIAYDAAFALPLTIYKGTDTQFEIWSNPGRTAYFRVSAFRGNQNSPWSNTVIEAANEQPVAGYLMNSSPEALDATQQVLLTVHQAMLRLSAARADLFSVLSLPREFDSQHCATYASQLRGRLSDEDGDSTLSYAGIYFPWLIVRDAADDQPGAVRSVTPEGTILGSIASLTIASGAWFAPGNRLLQGIVDLDPPTTSQAPLIFFDNQLNLVVQEPRGFLTMSSFTLSASPQLEDINVRRLLILLRRLALREGVDYVFQPNDSSFWRVVQRRFEEVLGDLFLKGAFAGSKQAESFRVRADSSVNPPESVEEGRFIVELRVAPSLPLEFLTVRLLQSGGDLSVSEEI
jgi:hypothetical protein